MRHPSPAGSSFLRCPPPLCQSFPVVLFRYPSDYWYRLMVRFHRRRFHSWSCSHERIGKAGQQRYRCLFLDFFSCRRLYEFRRLSWRPCRQPPLLSAACRRGLERRCGNRESKNRTRARACEQRVSRVRRGKSSIVFLCPRSGNGKFKDVDNKEHSLWGQEVTVASSLFFNKEKNMERNENVSTSSSAVLDESTRNQRCTSVPLTEKIT